MVWAVAAAAVHGWRGNTLECGYTGDGVCTIFLSRALITSSLFEKYVVAFQQTRTNLKFD